MRLWFILVICVSIGTMTSKEKKYDLSKVPAGLKNTPLWRRMTKDQREYCFCHLWNLSPVKESTLNEEFQVPEVRELYRNGWEKWWKLDGPYCENSVKEFLTTMEVAQDEEEDGTITDVGVEGVVNTVQVRITAFEFNSYFGCEPPHDPNLTHVDGVEEMMSVEGYEEEIERAYLKPGQKLSDPSAYQDLATKAKIMNGILGNRVFSVKNVRYAYPDRLALVYCIERRNIVVNLGHHVMKSLMEAAKYKSAVVSIVFPRLISLFCQLAGVRLAGTSPNWVFKIHNLLKYGEVRKRKTPTSGDENEAREGMSVGVEGFVAAENEPTELTSFMQQMYTGRRRIDDFMTRHDEFMGR